MEFCGLNLQQRNESPHRRRKGNQFEKWLALFSGSLRKMK
jgi:hypothetical protein